MSRLLLIDDDALTGSIIQKSLLDNEELICAENGDAGIAAAIETKPDVILLDIEMPGKNGYEVCDILKHSEATKNIPVIFVSSKASLREKILGYEMGGDDYIEKPFDPELLLIKIEKIKETHGEKIKLLNKIENVSKTAQEAISGSSELSLMVKYQQGIQSLSSHETIVKCFFEITKQLGLESCLLLDIDHNKVFYSSTGENKPLEQEMMYLLFNEQNRFSDFGCRTQITYPNIALLIKNMPLNDAYRYGRLKDILPIMIEATSSKLVSIETELLLQQQSEDVKKAADITNKTLEGIVVALQKNHKNGKQFMHKMINKLQDRLPNMGLEEDQEKFIFETIEEGISNAYNITEEGELLEKSINNLVKIFEDIQKKQSDILAIYTHKNENQGKGPEILNDIELF